MKQLFILFTAILLTAGVCSLFRCTPPLHHEKHRFFRMSTMVDVVISSRKSDADLQPVWGSVDSLLALWEERYSQSNPRSEVRGLNTRAREACRVDRRLGAMVADAIAYGDTTGGLFDATIAPVKNLWGLGETDTIHRIPDADTLTTVLKHVDYHKVRTNPTFDTVFFADSLTRIDAGGFAKGYALIETARLLDARGFTDYLVTAGDVVAKGRRSDGLPWRIGIMHPRRENELIATVPFDTGAIFTSGDYENFWMAGTRRIHHIFNPRIGCSCTNNQSVTIASTSAIQAKYLSTGLFCMPADSIVSFVEKRGLNCFVVDSAGRTYISRGWKDKVDSGNSDMVKM
jgi:FAD:protein FMN transferase